MVTVDTGGVIPTPPDHRAARWDPDTRQLESIVLATVHMWTLSHHKTIVVPMILRHFVAADVYDCMCELAVSVGIDKPKGHRNTVERSAGELYADELYDMITSLAANKTLPKIIVSSLALPMVPLATLRTSDEVSISARLESLETGLRKLTDCVNKGGTRFNQPEVTVTMPPIQQQQQGVGNTQGDQLQVERQNTASFAAVAASGGTGGTGHAGQQRQRLGSQGRSQKRARNGSAVGESDGEEPFKQVQNRRRRPVTYGSSQVDVGNDGLAAPVEFYVGNTTPAANVDIIKDVLVKCAKGIESDTQFSVLKVTQLAKHIENPRTKCWKVEIPYKFKELMEKDEMYPTGWCHRKFFAPRRPENPSKQPRKEDNVVLEAIKEQERLEEAKRQELEDRRLSEMAVDNSGKPEAASAKESVDSAV